MTVKPLLKVKKITHKHGLCEEIVVRFHFCTLPLSELEGLSHT